MKHFNKIISVVLTIVIMGCMLTACSNNTEPSSSPNTELSTELNTLVDKVIAETKDLSEEEFLYYVGEYALNAREIVPISKAVEAKRDTLSEEGILSAYQFEWVNIIYNITKYQSLLDVYDGTIIFNDDGTLNMEETNKNVTDGVLQSMINTMKENGLEIVWNNDAIYVSTDVAAFRNKIADYVGEDFTDYLNIVEHTDSTYFVKDGKVFSDNIVDCMIFEEDFLRNHLDSEIWETIHNQFYAQMQMYVGLYGLGGFFNEDRTYNSDFMTTMKADIENNYGTYFATIGAAIVDQIENMNASEELDVTKLNTIVSYCIDNEFADEMVAYMDMFGTEDEYETIYGEGENTEVDIGDSSSNEEISEDSFVILGEPETVE